MYIRQVAFGSPQFDEMLKLRDDLLRRPLGLTFEEEDISEEAKLVQKHLKLLQ